MLLAIDPGKTIGWCLFDDNYHWTGEMGEVKITEFHEFLDSLTDISTVVYESFVLFGHKAQQQVGSKMETVEAIGILKTFARIWKADIIAQPSSLLPVAEKWTGNKVPKHGVKGHDMWSAYNHGMYYLIRTGKRNVDVM